MYKNRINLEKYGIAKNQEFVKRLHGAELEGKIILFDKVDRSVSWNRERDYEMNIERFVEFLEKGIERAVIDIGAMYEDRPEEIDHMISAKVDIPRLAYCIFPYTPGNYEKLLKIFEESFGQVLESIEVEDYQKEIYEKLERHNQYYKKKPFFRL